MEPTNLTLEILRSIRDGVHGIAARVDQTNERLDRTVERLDQTVERFDRLERRQVESELRVATELTAISGTLVEMRDALRADRADRRQVEIDQGRRIDDHEARLQRLESRGA